MSILQANGAGLGGAGDPGGALAGGALLGSYAINQSLRFDGSTSYLEFTPSSAATDSSKMTFSTWVKTWGSGIGDGYILSAGSSYIDGVGYQSLNNFTFARNGTTAVTGNAVRRDPSAWYHLYVTYDADGESKVKIYVNGELDNEASQSTDLGKLGVNGQLQRIVRKSNASTYLDLYLAEAHFIDGSIVPISTFAETIDGVWVPKETSGITYGNNGWYLPFTQDVTGGNSINFGTARTAAVTYSDAASFVIGASDDFTIEFFFKTQDVGANYGNFMGDYATSYHLIGYDFRSSTRNIYFYSGNGQSLAWAVAGNVTLSNGTWHHMVFQRDGTTLRAYIDGTRLTSISNVSSSWTLSDGKATNFNKAYSSNDTILGDPHGQGMSGSLSNVRYVIGNTVYADDDNNITVPTTTLTAVTGTKLLTAVNATLGDDISTENNDGTTSGSPTLSYDSPFTTSNFYDDASGNGNHWTAYNLDENDVVPDSPTNNFPTINSVFPHANMTFSEGNLRHTTSTNNRGVVANILLPKSGKWYWEHWSKSFNYSTDNELHAVGINVPTVDIDGSRGGWDTGVTLSSRNGQKNVEGTRTAYDSITGWAENEGCGVVFDADAGTIAWTVNGGSLGSAVTIPSGTDIDWIPFVGMGGGTSSEVGFFNFGQDGTFAGETTSGGYSDANGYGDFKWQPPTGALALCTANLPDSIIGPNKSEQADDYFETILYTGNGATRHIGSGGAQHPIDVTTIANGLLFDRAGEHELARTFGSGGNRRKWTFSTWMKRTDLLASGNDHYIFGTNTGAADSTFMMLVWRATDALTVTGQSTLWLKSNKSFQSVSDWYHIVWVLDTDNATDAEKMRLYVDGTEITSFATDNRLSLSGDQAVNAAVEHNLGVHPSATGYGLDAYLADTIFVDGQAYGPEEFGQVGSNGYWIPKAYSGTYGSTGFRLTYEGTGTATTADGTTAQTNIGDDQSGSGRNFGIIGSTIDSHDVKTDSPTQNFNTFDPKNSYSSGSRLSEGNLRYTHDGANGHHTTTLAFNSSGNWYWEVDLTNLSTAWMGIVDANQSCTGAGSINGYFWYPQNGYRSENPYGTSDAWIGTTATTGDIIGFQIKNEVMTIYKNGVSLGSPFTIAPGSYRPFTMSPGAGTGISTFNFGADDTFAGSKTSGSAAASDANGYGSFYYTPPTDALAIVDDNIPVEGIVAPDLVWIKNRTTASTDHYLVDSVRGDYKQLISNSNAIESTNTNNGTKLEYNGFTIGALGDTNTSGNSYVAWTWKAGGPSPTQTYTVKVVSDSGNKFRFDDFGTSAVTLSLQEGGTYTFDQSDSSNATHPLRFSTTSDGTHNSGSEYTVGVTTSGTPGSAGAKTVITVAAGAPTLYYYCSTHSGMGGQANTTETHGSSNFKGSIQSVVSASQDAGFSVVSYSGVNTTTGQTSTIGHGLASAPELIICKRLNDAQSWSVGSTDIGNFTTSNVYSLDSTGAPATTWADEWGANPTSTVFTTGYSNRTNISGGDFIAYCFHSVDGFSKTGLYVANNSADGPFTYTGFRPAWVMIKNTNNGSVNWLILDTDRSTFNEMNDFLYPNTGGAESASTVLKVDFLSNGFKIRNASYGETNAAAGHNFIYLAFAETPFKYANAR